MSPNSVQAQQTVTKLTLSDALVLEGSGYEMGVQQGLALRSTIAELNSAWLRPKLRAVPFLIEWFAKQKARHMAEFMPEDFKDEIRGMTELAGLDYDTGLIINSIPDIMEIASRPFACSTFVVLPQRSQTGGLLYGRNLDYSDSDVLRPYWTPTVFAKTGKLRIFSINVPGMSGVLTAINEKGVMVSRMTSYSQDKTSHGISSMILMRQILETAQTAAEAADLYRRAARTVAVNIMISDPKTAVVVEATAHKFELRTPSAEGLLYSANHYESPSLKDWVHGRDERWPHLARFDGTGTIVSPADVLETMALAETRGSNILAVVVDYQAKTLTFGSDAEGRGTAARGKLFEMDLSSFLQIP